jgi:hypothetical protein
MQNKNTGQPPQRWWADLTDTQELADLVAEINGTLNRELTKS